MEIKIEAIEEKSGKPVPVIMEVEKDTIEFIRADDSVGGNVHIGELTIPDSYVHCGEKVMINNISPKLFRVGSYGTEDNRKIATPNHPIDKLIISNGIKNIDKYAFGGTCLQEVIWPAGCKKIPQGCFRYSKILTINNISEVEKIESGAFMFCGHITTFDWPSNCKVIPLECFLNCENLCEINNIENVEAVKKSAFQSCEALSSLNWPQKAKIIPEYCFSDCLSLTEISGIENVEEINSSAFDSSGITSFNWPKNAKSIPNDCFSCTDLRAIEGIENVTSIGERAFEDCDFEKFVWPENCSVIPAYCFHDCKYLSNVIVHNDITEIGERAFQGTGLKELDLSGILGFVIYKGIKEDIPNVVLPFYCCN
jgi:hypothetical protein